MRLTGEVRRELSMHAPQNIDSVYKVRMSLYERKRQNIKQLIVF